MVQGLSWPKTRIMVRSALQSFFAFGRINLLLGPPTVDVIVRIDGGR